MQYDYNYIQTLRFTHTPYNETPHATKAKQKLHCNGSQQKHETFISSDHCFIFCSVKLKANTTVLRRYPITSFPATVIFTIPQFLAYPIIPCSQWQYRLQIFYKSVSMTEASIWSECYFSARFHIIPKLHADISHHGIKCSSVAWMEIAGGFCRRLNVRINTNCNRLHFEETYCRKCNR